jgi:hypothetical protein
MQTFATARNISNNQIYTLSVFFHLAPLCETFLPAYRRRYNFSLPSHFSNTSFSLADAGKNPDIIPPSDFLKLFLKRE